jgi:hypothetical protein
MFRYYINSQKSQKPRWRSAWKSRTAKRWRAAGRRNDPPELPTNYTGQCIIHSCDDAAAGHVAAHLPAPAEESHQRGPTAQGAWRAATS